MVTEYDNGHPSKGQVGVFGLAEAVINQREGGELHHGDFVDYKNVLALNAVVEHCPRDFVREIIRWFPAVGWRVLLGTVSSAGLEKGSDRAAVGKGGGWATPFGDEQEKTLKAWGVLHVIKAVC